MGRFSVRGENIPFVQYKTHWSMEGPHKDSKPGECVCLCVYRFDILVKPKCPHMYNIMRTD